MPQLPGATLRIIPNPKYNVWAAISHSPEDASTSSICHIQAANWLYPQHPRMHQCVEDASSNSSRHPNSAGLCLNCQQLLSSGSNTLPYCPSCMPASAVLRKPISNSTSQLPLATLLRIQASAPSLINIQAASRHCPQETSITCHVQYSIFNKTYVWLSEKFPP